jgi:PknH-like extracellular domain/TIR domain
VKVVLTMAHDVMISHSHADKTAADAVCAALEARGIRCWIAPRDINPGRDWAASIVEAIRDARIMLLVFSQHANQSPQVRREVERAANSGKVLLPLRIEDVLPEEALQYYLGTPHWLDAITPPFEAHLEKLADACSSLLAVTGRLPQQATNDPAPVVAASATEQPSVGESGEAEPSVSLQPPARGSVSTSTPAEIQPADHRPPMMLWWRRQRRQVQVGLIAAIVLILAATTGITGYLLRQPSTTSTTTAPTTATPTIAPPVAPAALDGLLLSPDQINNAMGATGMRVTRDHSALSDLSANVPDKDCRAIQSAGETSAYTGSGWSAVREQKLEDGPDIAHDKNVLLQWVVSFPSADQAAAYFTASSQRWLACSNRTFTYTLNKPGTPDVVYDAGPVANRNGILSDTYTQEGTGGWACQRALTVTNNIAIDITACSLNPADSAVDIAHQIAAKVPKQ